MSEMIERVAGAIKNADIWMHSYEEIARAAIAAMREPTFDMVRCRWCHGTGLEPVDDEEKRA